MNSTTTTTTRRYNLIDESDLAAAVAKRFGNGKQGANIEPSTFAAGFCNFQPQQFLGP